MANSANLSSPVNIVILLRNYAAVDHLVPLIHALKERKEYSIRIIGTNFLYNIFQDNRIIALLGDGKIVAEDVRELATAKILLLLTLRKWVGQLQNSPYPLNSLLKFVGRRLQRKLACENELIGAAELLKRESCPKVHILITDHNANRLCRNCAREVRMSGGVTMTFPHSIDFLSNQLRAVDMMYRPPGYAVQAQMLDIYDYVIVNSVTEKRLIASAVENQSSVDHIRVMGSLRYSRQWISRRDAEIPAPVYNFPELGEPALRILFLCPKRSVNIFWDELLRVVRVLASIEDCAVCIKGPAKGDQGYVSEFQRMGLRNIDVVALKYDTSSIIDWADVVFWVDTTVFHEALLKGKPTVHLDLLWTNTTFVDGHPAMWQARSRDEVFAILDQWRYDKNYRPYSDNEANDLIHKTANSIRGNVFSDAINFIDEVVATSTQIPSIAAGSSSVGDIPGYTTT